MSKLARAGKLVAKLLGSYLVCWAIAYVVVNGDFDIGLMVEYFGLAWTFNAFVRPAQTQVVSVGLFVLFQLSAFAYGKWTRRNRKPPVWMEQDS